MKICLLFLVMALAMPSLGQSHPSSGGKSALSRDAASEDVQPVIPTRRLEFKATEPVPGLTASPVIILPTQCNSNGTLFLEMLDPPSFMQHTIYSIAGKKSQAFSVSAISDLHEVQLISAFPSASMVGFLVRATKTANAPQKVTPADPASKPSASANGQVPTTGAHASDYHYYIARFGLNGNYKDFVELPMNYPLFHLAILPSGEFLIAGFDRNNGVARLLLLNPSGELVRSIQLPSAIEDHNAPADHTSADAVVASSKLLSSILFTSYRDSVLVWRRDSNAPIIEIRAGGAVREVPISTPRGYVLSYMVPSNTLWIGCFHPASQRGDGPQNVSDSVYYELRPSDGSLSSKLELSGDHTAAIECENDGTFIAHQRDDDGKLTRLLAQ